MGANAETPVSPLPNMGRKGRLEGRRYQGCGGGEISRRGQVSNLPLRIAAARSAVEGGTWVAG